MAISQEANKPVKGSCEFVALCKSTAEHKLGDTAEVVGICLCHLGEVCSCQGGFPALVYRVKGDTDSEKGDY